MTNGTNAWGISFSRISFLEKVLQNHGNVASVGRNDDIVFEIDRKTERDHLRIVCCDEYSLGMLVVQRALSEFSPLNIIYAGGNWSGYTPEAKDYCLNARLGLFNSTEINGALWRKDYWAYHKVDEDRNPIYCYKSA